MLSPRALRPSTDARDPSSSNPAGARHCSSLTLHRALVYIHISSACGPRRGPSRALRSFTRFIASLHHAIAVVNSPARINPLLDRSNVAHLSRSSRSRTVLPRTSAGGACPLKASNAMRLTPTTRSHDSGGSRTSLGHRARQRSSKASSAPAPASMSNALASPP